MKGKKFLNYLNYIQIKYIKITSKVIKPNKFSYLPSDLADKKHPLQTHQCGYLRVRRAIKDQNTTCFYTYSRPVALLSSHSMDPSKPVNPNHNNVFNTSRQLHTYFNNMLSFTKRRLWQNNRTQFLCSIRDIAVICLCISEAGLQAPSVIYLNTTWVLIPLCPSSTLLYVPKPNFTCDVPIVDLRIHNYSSKNSLKN